MHVKQAVLTFLGMPERELLVSQILDLPDPSRGDLTIFTVFIMEGWDSDFTTPRLVTVIRNLGTVNMFTYFNRTLTHNSEKL